LLDVINAKLDTLCTFTVHQELTLMISEFESDIVSSIVELNQCLLKQ
jgi:hypothetical protein